MASKAKSMQDIADALGVSRASVSNALRGTGRLSEATRARILAKASEVDFTPSGLGRALRTGRSHAIGLVLPDFRMPLFAEFASAFGRAARARDLALTVADSLASRDVQTENLIDLSARGLDALILVPMRGTDPETLKVRTPLVVVDAVTNPLNTVCSDHRMGGTLIGEHLAQAGHRKVLIMTAPGTEPGAIRSFVNAERLRGMTDVFDAHGIGYRIVELPATVDSARDFIADWMPGDISAIAATYDTLAVGAIMALTERYIDIPGKIAVSGYDDTIWSKITIPSLTTIQQDLATVAERALAHAMGENVAPGLVPVSLVVRASTSFPHSQQDPSYETAFASRHEHRRA